MTERWRAQLQREGRLMLALKVQPRSARTEWAGELADGTCQLKVAAVPEEGQANAEVCRFLAVWFGVPKDCVRLVSGATSRRKTVCIVQQD